MAIAKPKRARYGTSHVRMMNMRVTAAEYRLVELAAQASGETMSEFARVAVRRKVRDVVKLVKAGGNGDLDEG